MLYFFFFGKGCVVQKKADGSWELFPYVKMIETHESVLKSWSVETLVARPAGTTSSWRLV